MLDLDGMTPTVAEVVEITERRDLAAVEVAQVAVPPVEGGLDREMKLPQMPGPGNDELSPDRRLNLGKRDPDLERIGFSVEHGTK
jgi:hypothetical protein